MSCSSVKIGRLRRVHRYIMQSFRDSPRLSFLINANVLGRDPSQAKQYAESTHTRYESLIPASTISSVEGIDA